MCLWRSVVIRAILFLFGWWVLAEGSFDQPWLIGLGVVVAVVASLALFPHGNQRWKPWRVVVFVPWFVWNSILGGFDVAIRAFSRDMKLDPGIVPIQLQYGEMPSLLLAWVVSLLPGTACVLWREKEMEIHILDRKSDPMPKVHELERKLNRMAEEFDKPDPSKR